MFTKEEKRRYISILADGKFHETVPMGTEDSVIREYETSDGKKGTKNELVYTKIVGNITGISFIDGDYGESLHVTVTGDEGDATITVGTSSRFGTDIMKRLPNVDFNHLVEIAPWALEDNGKKKMGVVIKQLGEKLTSHFDSQAGDGKWITINGMPSPKSDQTSSQWKLYFLQVQEFLTNYTKENICPNLNNKPATKEIEEADDLM